MQGYMSPEQAEFEKQRALKLTRKMNDVLKDTFDGVDHVCVENAIFLWIASFIYLAARGSNQEPQDTLEISINKLRLGFKMIERQNASNPELETELERLRRSNTKH